jgi:tetratricopeptide (TPR) repeat protein
MRVATVVASSYERSPALPRLALAPELGRAIYDRFALSDTAFAVEWFEGHRDFPEELEGVLGELPAAVDTLLFYFTGYVVWQPGRTPALGLDAPRPRAFPLSRLCGILDRFCAEYLLVLDVTEQGHPGGVVADAIRDVLAEHAPRAGGLVAVAPTPPVDVGASLAGLVLRSLAALEGQPNDVTTHALYQQMSPELTWLDASAAVRYAAPSSDCVLLPGLGSDAAPSGLLALARYAAGLRQRRAYAELADVYQSMLDVRERGTTHELARRIGELCRSELGDPWRAIHALEHLLVTDGASAALRFELSELYVATDQRDLALEHCLEGLALEPRDVAGYRRARWLFERTAQIDRAWNAAQALTCLGVADQEEAEAADRHRPEGLQAATATLTEEHWATGLSHPRRHAALEQVLKLVSTPAMEYRLAQKKHLWVPDPTLRQDPKTSTTTLCRSLTWTARLLGVPAPELYVHASDRAEMHAAPALQPTTRVSKAFATGLSLPELAFLWGRHLTYFRPDHYLRVFYPTLEEMTSVLLAAMLASDWDPQRVREHDPDTTRLATHLRRTLDESALGLLRAATKKLTPAKGRARLGDWVRSVARVANRAGLLACGDVRVAAEMIHRFPIEAPDVDEVGDLLQFSLTEAYAELRERLGVAVG